jgi:hypothetical protein
MKHIYKILSVMLILLASSAMAQNQKVWTGTHKYFGVDSTANRGATVTWTVVKPTGSTSVQTDSIPTGHSRAIFTRINWVNGTAAMLVDTVKVTETLNGCISSITTKPIEVYPLPICSLSTNQTLCAGAAPANITLTISNYPAISGIGPLNLSYELRAGSPTGTPLGGASSGSITNITSGTIPPITINTASWPALANNTTYYLIITNFGSDIVTAGANPAPGNVSTASLALAASFPQTYTITVQPAIAAPTIIAY